MERKEQIREAAAAAAEGCREDVKPIFSIAFRKGAEWADSTSGSCPVSLPKFNSVSLKRNADGTLSEKTREILRVLPCNMAVIFLDKNDNTLHFLNPDAHAANGYAVLDDLRELDEVGLIYVD